MQTMLQELQGVPNQINAFSADVIRARTANRIPFEVKKLWARFINECLKEVPSDFSSSLLWINFLRHKKIQ